MLLLLTRRCEKGTIRIEHACLDVSGARHFCLMACSWPCDFYHSFPNRTRGTIRGEELARHAS